MKKIIYSLVIMIAAGSLFTSCIEQIEPVGILDMRTAKAEYIRALKDLRAADAEYRRAEAAVQQANAAYRQAEAAWMQEKVNEQKLFNELQALYNEAQEMDNMQKAAEVANEIDKLEKRMEERELEHAATMAELQAEVAEAENALRIVLRDIALSAQDLTADEKMTIQAACDYYWQAYEEVAKQSIAELKAQRKVDSLKEAKQRFADKSWDNETLKYQYKVDLWQRAIDRATKNRAKYQAIYDAAPKTVEAAYEDVKEWKETLKALQDDEDDLEYSKHELVEEISKYYVNYVHDGYKEFQNAVTAWKEENVKPSKDALSHEDSVLVKEGEKKPEDFKKSNAKAIAFPALTAKQVGNTTIFNKFAYLLSSYNQESPVAFDPKKNFIVNDPADSLKIPAVNQSMKAFILGAEDAGENSQVLKDKKGKVLATASYGLKGAYSILERELVSDPDKAPTAKEIADALKAKNEKDSIWAAHRQILIDGLAKYEPYTKAIDAFKKASDEANTAEGNMAKAVATLKTAFKSCNSGAVSTNDSVRILNAFKEFATARETYLGYEYSKKGHDSTYFVFSKGKGTGDKFIPDSVKFADLNFDDLAKGKYNWEAKDPGDKNFKTTSKSFETAKTVGLANIAMQLLGQKVAELLAAPVVGGWDLDAATINDGTNYVAFYRTYMFVDGDPAYVADPVSGDPIESAVVTAAEDDVIKAVNSFVGVYNSFWAQSVADVTKTAPATPGSYETYFSAVKDELTAAKIKTAKENAEKAVASLFDTKLNPKNYTAATFKPYGDEEPIVTFTNGFVDTTIAMQAILASVDPLSTGADNNAQWAGKKFEDATAIFKGGNTDFYKATKAAYDYWKLTNTKVKENLKEIKDWIDAVEAAFVADAEQAGENDKDAYEKWQKDYKAANALVDSIANYAKALKEFTGEDKDGNANGIFVLGNYNTLSKFFNQTSEKLTFELADQSIFGEFNGEWAEKLGGKQLELAKALFPEAPAKLMEWEQSYKEINDDIAHNKIVRQALEKAYVAASKAAGYVDDGVTKFDDVIKALKTDLNDYLNTLKSTINGYTTTIQTNSKNIADFWSEKPMIDIAIAEAETELATVKTKLAAAQTALDYAKENLKRVLDYIKGLDVTLVNGYEFDFPWNASSAK